MIEDEEKVKEVEKSRVEWMENNQEIQATFKGKV